MAETPKKNKGRNKGWDNLKPAKKGEIRNPNGRPKKSHAISDILNELLQTKVGEKTRREIILEQVVKMAVGGDWAAIHFIADRTEGKALERIMQKLELDEVEIK